MSVLASGTRLRPTLRSSPPSSTGRCSDRGETVLVVPWGQFGLSMLWQAETGMWFRMAGGYLAPAPPPDYQNDSLMPAFSGQAKPTPALVHSFLVRRHVNAVILAPGAPVQWLDALAVLGLKPISLGGVLVYRV